MHGFEDILAQLVAVQVLGQLELPVALVGDELSLHFVEDGKHGIALHAIEHHASEGSFKFLNARPSEYPNVDDLGLWRIRGTHRAGGPIAALSPEDAEQDPGVFKTIGSSGEPAVLLVWKGIKVANAEEDDTLFLATRISLEGKEILSRWNTWVGREQGASFSIDEVDCPLLNIKGPIVPRQGEPHALAQVRARLCVPNIGNPFVPTSAANSSLGLWIVAGFRADLIHPEAQCLQFSLMYAADSTDQLSFRRMLYLGTEDREGYRKIFRYRGRVLTDKESKAEGFLRWTSTYFPPFEDGLAVKASKPRTEFGNTFASAYPVVVGAIHAKGDDYWYDGCDYYRNWIEDEGIVGDRLEDNKDLGSAGSHPHILVGSLLTTGGSSSGLPVYERFEQITRAVEKALDNPYIEDPRIFMHWHTWLKGGLGVDSFTDGIGNPNKDIDASFDDGVRDVIKMAQRRHVGTTLYTIPTIIGRSGGFGVDFPPNAVAYLRNGQIASGNPLVIKLNYGTSEAQTWFVENIYREMLVKHGMSGMYLDHFPGRGPDLFYHGPGAEELEHAGHGGSYSVQGLIKLVKNCRALAKSESRLFDRNGNRDFIIGSENPLEFLAGTLDYTQDGYIWLSDHFLLAEDPVLSANKLSFFDMTGVPDMSRNMSPPLWNTVYHEWAPGHRRLLNGFSNIALATNRQFHPDSWSIDATVPEKLYPGVSSEELVDLYCFEGTTAYVSGSKPLFFIFYGDSDLYSPIFFLDSAGQVTVDRNIDPEGSGLTIASFYRLLYSSLNRSAAGQFILYGRKLRDLKVIYDREVLSLAENPMVPGLKISPRYPALLFYNHPDLPAEFTGGAYGLGFLEFDVPRVMQSVWRSQEGRVGIVLVNWSNKEASWRGTFDPALYELKADVERTALLIGLGGEETQLRRYRGSVTVDATGQPGAEDIALGRIPPHEIRILIMN